MTKESCRLYLFPITELERSGNTPEQLLKRFQTVVWYFGAKREAKVRQLSPCSRLFWRSLIDDLCISCW
jgi:hypothetical protein